MKKPAVHHSSCISVVGCKNKHLYCMQFEESYAPARQIEEYIKYFFLDISLAG
jgi:hypothetical protein